VTLTAVRGTGAEAVRLLRDLIRIDTSNPPGNERPAQELLAGVLSAAGVECELLAADPARPNLVATLRGRAPGPVLCLLGHVDTVPARAAEWSFDPWGGETFDGEVRGRGAQDMKGQVAAEVIATAALARTGWRPARGELKLVITVDEETDASLGARWLCEHHADEVRADLVVNEGGGGRFEVGGRRFYTLGVAEKGVFRFWLRTHGVAGHASVPGLADNALLRLAPVLERLRNQPQIEPTPEGTAFLNEVVGEEDRGSAASQLERLRVHAPDVAIGIAEPMLRVTLAPTKVKASESGNVIPSQAEVFVDCRTPPGMELEAVYDRVRSVLGPLAGDVEIDQVQTVIGNRSPVDTRLTAAIREWLVRTDPDATLVPIAMAGFSDSHWFRRAFGSAIVYGFCPRRQFDELGARAMFHAADERASIADIELATRFFWELPQRLLT
jgi:acetylornithine deacetylase/succinyl-diaminopimelate desuccinylase-like protein